MSGTSADGIDGVIVHVSEAPSLDLVQAAFHHHQLFTPLQREAVFSLFDSARATAEHVCRMNFLLGEWFAAAALETVRAAGLSPADVDLIGSHGQTVVHLPPAPRASLEAPGSVTGGGSTLQIGEPAVIAERTGITTVGDFRVRDMAAGGQGAPLVSYVDALLFHRRTAPRAVLNIGGIANATVLLPLESGRPSLAFDTGPGNMVLDELTLRVSQGAERYDRDGDRAASGTAQDSLLAQLLTDPYFAAPAPKTTGRERYGAAYTERVWQQAQALGLSDVDLLATATALTAETIAGALRTAGLGRTAGGEVIVGGGGTRNRALMAELARRLPGVALTTHESFGISSQAKEALSFAILASAAVRGQVNTLPTCTGAGRAVVMGKLVPGENYRTLMAGLFAPEAP
ncbi:MAG: anhydro-N-acetylmuramic acid kinase [Chloroflexota bacterium]|nr:anhydro-N-acetylmuramic acid kinase [Chloroflexota bacterium]